jgi:hypothetical protein
MEPARARPCLLCGLLREGRAGHRASRPSGGDQKANPLFCRSFLRHFSTCVWRRPLSGRVGTIRVEQRSGPVEAKEARQLPLAGFMLDTTQRLRSPSLPPRELELFSSARCDYLGRMFKDLIFAFPLNPSVFLTARIGFTRSSRMDIASGWSAAARACA